MNELLLDILTSDAFGDFALWLLSAVVSAFLGSRWWTEKVDRRVQETVREAWKTLEAVVEETWADAQRLKAESGGRLTANDKQILEDIVRTRLSKIAMETGFDVIAIIGDRYLGTAITHVVRRLKGTVDQTPLAGLVTR